MQSPPGAVHEGQGQDPLTISERLASQQRLQRLNKLRRFTGAIRAFVSDDLHAENVNTPVFVVDAASFRHSVTSSVCPVYTAAIAFSKADNLSKHSLVSA